jgi:hypothetical protein
MKRKNGEEMSGLTTNQKGCLVLVVLFIAFVACVSQLLVAPMVLNAAGATTTALGDVVGGLAEQPSVSTDFAQVITASEPLVRIYLFAFVAIATVVGLGFAYVGYQLFWPKKPAPVGRKTFFSD